MVAWLVLNICIAAVCVAVIFVQSPTCKRRVLVNSTITTMLLDATAVADHLSEHLKGPGSDAICNMSYLSHKEMTTKVKLEWSEGSHTLQTRSKRPHFRQSRVTKSNNDFYVLILVDTRPASISPDGNITMLNPGC